MTRRESAYEENRGRKKQKVEERRKDYLLKEMCHMCPAEVSAATIEQQSRVSQDQKQEAHEGR